MHLTLEEKNLLEGQAGKATQKAMQILVGLGKIYGAQRLIPVSSVQVAGVSFDNLGEAGLEFLDEMAQNGARAQVFSTLNPAGMDLENWNKLGIDPEFAEKQLAVIHAYESMGIQPTCSCTPYLIGNKPAQGDHIAWAESSAVCYANSVLGARTNREGGPSALASALTGKTAEYGFHLESERAPAIGFDISPGVIQPGAFRTHLFGLLGKVIGEALVRRGRRMIPTVRGIQTASLEELKSLSASLATFGGLALFHLEGITPEAGEYKEPNEYITIRPVELSRASAELNDGFDQPPDFFSLGCPHLSLDEIAEIARLVEGKIIRKEFWITTSRPVKQMADQLGYTGTIEASGILFATDTCCVVSPIRGRFSRLATDSAKACYYAQAKNNFKVNLLPFDQVIDLATK